MTQEQLKNKLTIFFESCVEITDERSMLRSECNDALINFKLEATALEITPVEHCRNYLVSKALRVHQGVKINNIDFDDLYDIANYAAFLKLLSEEENNEVKFKTK